MKIYWENSEVKLDKSDQVIALLRKVAVERGSDNAIGVELIKDDGETMTAILYCEGACLGWFPSEYDGLGSYHTIKDDFDPDLDEISENPELITYFLQGNHGEIPIEYTISLDQALKAVAMFCDSQGRPDSVRWDMD